MPTPDEIKAAGGNDVGDWGEKDIRGAYATPFMVGGEPVDLDKLPAFGDEDESAESQDATSGDAGSPQQ